IASWCPNSRNSRTNGEPMKPFPPIKRIRIRERVLRLTWLILLGVGKTDLDFAQKLHKHISHQENGICRSTNYQSPGSSSRQATRWRRGAVIRDLGAAGIRLRVVTTVPSYNATS